MSWFENWFDENYLSVYQHRNDLDALKQTELILKNVPLTKKDALLDLGCGNGRHVEIFHKKKFFVEGIDLSPTLINLAKQRNPELNLKVANFLTYKNRNYYTLITSLFTSWGYYDSEEDNLLVFKNAYLNLKERGFFWLDYFNAHQIREELGEKLKEKHFASAKGEKIIEKKYIRKNKIIKEIEVISSTNKRKYLESVSLYDQLELVSVLEKLNFKIKKTFGDYSGGEYHKRSPRLILLMQK